MSTALFAEPIECEWVSGYAPEGGAVLVPALMLGLVSQDSMVYDDQAVIVVPDGTLRWVDASNIVTKWRYDETEKDWIDHSGPEEGPEASEEE